MGMDGSGLSVADALALQRDGYDNDGMFGGNGSWVFFLFFLLAWGGGFGWGNRGGEQVATSAEVQRGFDNQNVMNKLNGLFLLVNCAKRALIFLQSLQRQRRCLTWVTTMDGLINGL